MASVIKVSVRPREHIARGKVRNCWMCPVAFAMRDAGLWGVEVGPYYLNFVYGGAAKYTVPTPRKVARWIAAFDKTGKGKPFEFQIRLGRGA